MLTSVALLALDTMLSSSVAIPLEMLEAVRARLRLKKSEQANFSVQIVAQTLAAVSMLGGFKIHPSHTFNQLDKADLIVVPALWRNPKPQLKAQTQAIAWLKQQYQQGANIIAIGTGVCFLAEAGVLDGKPATTHWHYLEQFAKDYPRVLLKRQHLLTQAGRLFCAASVNSGADLMVHFIRLEYGQELAQKVEQQFSPEVRRAYEKRVFYAGQSHPDESIALVQTWLQQNLTLNPSLQELAAMVSLSPRQFNRRFYQMLGQTPGNYLTQLKIEAAKELLQQSNLSITDVALAVGYQDLGYFSRVFRRLNSQSPSEFRRKVRCKLFLI
ncbi:MAG: helix-turn-helix domain-containing protein [Venatoribacter sp.]